MKAITGEKDNSAKAEKLKQILEADYNIHSVSELEKAIKESPGVDIGIFTTPIKTYPGASAAAATKLCYMMGGLESGK